MMNGFVHLGNDVVGQTVAGLRCCEGPEEAVVPRREVLDGAPVDALDHRPFLEAIGSSCRGSLERGR